MPQRLGHDPAPPFPIILTVLTLAVGFLFVIGSATLFSDLV